jgi:hypothetical protein
MTRLALALLAAAAVVVLARWTALCPEVHLLSGDPCRRCGWQPPDDIDWLSEYLTRSVPTGNAATAWRN